jgi:hypothetical protein
MPQKIELINGYGALRSVLEAACAKAGCGLGDLTVLKGYGAQPSSRVQHFDLRLPGRRLRCACGHQLTAHDFDILEPKLVRAVCSRCHADLIVIEID